MYNILSGQAATKKRKLNVQHSFIFYQNRKSLEINILSRERMKGTREQKG